MFHAFNPFKGEIDNSCNISRGGSFTGCEQMGFLWSMKQAPGQKKGLRLAKKDVTKPYAIQLNCFNGHLSPEEGFVNSLKRNHLQPITSSSLEKSYMADGVQRISVREGRVRGTLFLPPGNGPFPGQCWSITSSSVLFFVHVVMMDVMEIEGQLFFVVPENIHISFTEVFSLDSPCFPYLCANL